MEELQELKTDQPTTIPKYFTCKKTVFGWLNLTKRLLDGVQGGSGAGFAASGLTQQIQAAAWFGVITFVLWLIRFGIGLYLDSAEIKETK